MKGFGTTPQAPRGCCVVEGEGSGCAATERTGSVSCGALGSAYLHSQLLHQSSKASRHNWFFVPCALGVLV
eukprot:1159851-Pelagomonas_calceolata.AAC.12